MTLFKFKVKYKDKDGTVIETEIELNTPSFSNGLVAGKLGISPSQIISVTKK